MKIAIEPGKVEVRYGCSITSRAACFGSEELGEVRNGVLLCSRLEGSSFFFPSFVLEWSWGADALWVSGLCGLIRVLCDGANVFRVQIRDYALERCARWEVS